MNWTSLIRPVVELFVKLLAWLDPEMREIALLRKKAKWGTQFILRTEAIEYMAGKLNLTKKEQRHLKNLKKQRWYYRKWFFSI